MVLVARRADKLEALAAALGRRADVLAADLSKPDERAALPDRVAELGLVVDVLVNNAGLSTAGPIAESDPAAELNLIEVDVAAVADLCSRFVPGMVSRGGGAVLNVASVDAFGPLPGQAGQSRGGHAAREPGAGHAMVNSSCIRITLATLCRPPSTAMR